MPQSKTLILLVGLAVGSAALALALKPPLLLASFLLLVLILIFYHRLHWGVYLLVGLYPFINWEFVWGDFNAPYVDIFALLLFTTWLVNCLVKKRFKVADFPGLLFFLLFLCSAGLSLINAPDWLTSVKYIFRPLGFFYLMYVVLPYNLISSRQILKRVLQIIYGLGLVVASCGLLSLFLLPAADLLSRRVQPIAIFGIYFLGTNQNQIAEILIVTVPIGLLLFYLAKTDRAKKLLLLGTGFMLLIGLLTFSRSGWIAFVLELVLLILIQYRYRLRQLLRPTLITSIIVIPLFIYLLFFSSQLLVQQSNSNRLLLLEIAWDVFSQHPWLGSGAGTFMDYVSQNPVYLIEFGSPLDAHGFIWKLLPELGIIGLGSFLALLVYCLWRIIKAFYQARANPDWAYYLLTFLLLSCGEISFQLFQTSYFVSRLWLPLGIALAICRLSTKRNAKTN